MGAVCKLLKLSFLGTVPPSDVLIRETLLLLLPQIVQAQRV